MWTSALRAGLRRRSQPLAGRNGIQSSARPRGAKWNDAGSTPTIVAGSPLTVTVRPTTSGRPPKRVRHDASLRTIAPGAPATVSASIRSRPSAGLTPSARKKPAVTRAIGTSSMPDGVDSAPPPPLCASNALNALLARFQSR